MGLFVSRFLHLLLHAYGWMGVSGTGAPARVLAMLFSILIERPIQRERENSTWGIELRGPPAALSLVVGW